MDERHLRCGYTTGTCAAAAAKAAAYFLWHGKIPEQVRVSLPEGKEAALEVYPVLLEGKCAAFRVQKDAGDDPDVTNESWIHALLKRITDEEWNQLEKEARGYMFEEYPGLYLTGGDGIGIVTCAGLSCPVGAYAINPVPRRMICRAVDEVRSSKERVCIQIEIPGGRELAEKTFNPRLGIVGGISVIGTTGIVRPMSEDALTATIRLELHMKAAAGETSVILTPGSYGERFLSGELELALDRAVVCSNFIADAAEMAASEGFFKLLLVGHVGKLIKVAAGARNTHSRYGDGRMEQLADLLCCAENSRLDEKMRTELSMRVLKSVTTDAAFDEMEKACPGLGARVMALAANRIQKQVWEWFLAAQPKTLDKTRMDVQVVTFSPMCGIIGKTEGALQLCGEFSKINEERGE